MKMNSAYKNYNGVLEWQEDAIIVSLWDAYLEAEGDDNKISLNNKEFFENSFTNAYDAAWAVSLSGKWTWSDDYVYFDGEGLLTSFSHWDDETSPIDLDKLDICQLVNKLKKCHRRYVDNIPMAIQDALK